MTDAGDAGRTGLRSVLRSLKVVEALAVAEPARVGQLANELGMTKASVQRSLQTLHMAGWIEQAEGEVTRWQLSGHARSVFATPDPVVRLREAAMPTIEQLRDRTNETVHLSVPGPGALMTIVERAESRGELRVGASIGSSFPMTATASGLAVLAALGDAAHADADAARDGWTAEEIRGFIARARERGYAVQPGPSREVIAVGAAITDSSGDPVAALAIVVPASRFAASDAARLGSDAMRASVEVSARLQTPWTAQPGGTPAPAASAGGGRLPLRRPETSRP